MPAAIRRLDPAIPEEAWEEALRKVLRVGMPSLTQTNPILHAMLRDGVEVEYRRAEGAGGECQENDNRHLR